ncbi:MAG: protein serine/threonine phosphatase 2C family protein [Lachnospiraceae bacterium]|nr:protein serine/threonine phosphatase 2C family protein [Lachnospiraceae bacterium]
MHFSYVNLWDKGDYYTKNQDSFSIQSVFTGNGPYAMALVCDGVGSLAKGEYAGGLTAKIITDWFYQNALDLLCRNASKEKLLCSFKRALRDVHEQLLRESGREGIRMGTTCSVLILSARHFYFFHIGDCSCYFIGNKVKEISVKQVNEKGELRGIVGAGRLPDIYFRTGKYKRHQRFLLCSDGYNRCLSMQGLTALASKNLKEMETGKLLQEILQRGRRKGERDNCTAIVIGRK